MDKSRKEMYQTVRDFRRKIEKSLADKMKADGSEHSTGSISGMTECWDKIHHMEDKLRFEELSPHETEEWMDEIKNADGSKGCRWSMEQTTNAAKSAGVMLGQVSKENFWAAMNMMYSDYCTVAEKYGVNKPEFFAEMAKAFLWDKDGPAPEAKLAAYYRNVVQEG